LSIFTPDASKPDTTNSELLFTAINKLLENLSKTKSTDMDMFFNFLFVLPSETSTAVVEIVTYPAAKQKNKISIYNPDNLFKNKLKNLTNYAKKSGYVANNSPKINSSHAEFKQHKPFSVYYFIKNSVKDYLKDCVLPNNTPTLIETTPLLTNQSGLPQAVANEIQINLGLASSTLEILTWNGVRFDEWPNLFSTNKVTLSQTETVNYYYLIKFPADSMFKTDKMAVFAKQENGEHALLSDIRHFLVFEMSNELDKNKVDKIVKNSLRMGDLRELFSQFAKKTETNQETKLYSTNRSSFFTVPNSTVVAPDPRNHLALGYK
jgi:hypothetical protein